MPGKGMFRVEDLLRSPALQLRLVAGADGTHRRVAWAHVSELEDPTPWLSGAEMIMTTGLAIPRTAAGQRAYIGRLDDAGVACLALSEGLHVPLVTRHLIAAADERSFPVMEVPIPVPFIAIAQEVSAVVQADTGQRLNAQLQVFGAVRWLASGSMSTEEIFTRLERLSGYSLYACTRHRGPLLDGIPVPPERYAHLIPETATSPPTVPGGYVLPVSAPRGTAGYILAMERPDAVPVGVSVVQHIATVAALQLSMLAHEREMLRREGAEILSEMLQGSLDQAAVRRRLAGSGFPAAEPLVLAIVRANDAAAYAEIADELAHGGFPHLILRQQDDLYVLIPADPATAEALTRVPGATAGLSRPFGLEASLVVARREAHWAVTRAAAGGRPSVRYDDDQIGRWLTGDMAGLRSLVADVLGAVMSYDQAHSGDLLPTLRTWLERDRQTDETARSLHIHPNTLLYRIRRFEEISGRSLASTESLAEVWLALRASAASESERLAAP
jgi:purine catabolism regulator